MTGVSYRYDRRNNNQRVADNSISDDFLLPVCDESCKYNWDGFYTIRYNRKKFSYKCVKCGALWGER